MSKLIRAGKGELNGLALATIGQVVWKTVGTQSGRDVARDFFQAERERERQFEPVFKGQPIPQ